MKIAVLPGDGIGKEIVSETVRVLGRLGVALSFEEAPVGGAGYEASGHPLPAATLALAFANVAALFHPQVIVLGGGVALMGSLFWDPLGREFARRVLPPFAAGVRLLPSALREDAVPAGALCLANQL